MLTCWCGHDEGEHHPATGACADLDGDGCRCTDFQPPATAEPG